MSKPTSHVVAVKNTKTVVESSLKPIFTGFFHSENYKLFVGYVIRSVLKDYLKWI